MNAYFTLLVFTYCVLVRGPVSALIDLMDCQDDFNLKPSDGMLKKNTFGWMAFVQYIHVTTGLPHHSKAPRVILVHKQFVIGTATDLLRLPKNYKLGNVIFGEYEREEVDCGVTRSQLRLGVKCPQAYLEVPLIDITPHPEYSRFGVGNSLALVKLVRPIKSGYMIPICLPTIDERMKKKKNKNVFLIDYISNVPRDFNSERMGKKTLKLFTHKECRRHRMKAKLGSEGVTHVLCSSGCGVRSGAPIISHNAQGGYELIGIAAGGGPCSRKSHRRRLIKEPPLYIDVYPYSTWITNIITAFVIPLPYPQNFRRTDEGLRIAIARHRPGPYDLKKQRSGWRSRTFLSGNFCYGKATRNMKDHPIFYSESFEVNGDPPAIMNIVLKIAAGIDCTIECARLQLPNRVIVPFIAGVTGHNVSITFNTGWFPYVFVYSLTLQGSTRRREHIVRQRKEQRDRDKKGKKAHYGFGLDTFYDYR